MEATFEQELNAVVCNVTGAIDNNEPIVKAKLIDCKAVDSFQVNLPSVSMRKKYKMRYKIITKFNLNINDSIVESDDAIGSYPLIPAWDTVVFIKYKNKWNQDATDCWNRKYGKVKIDLIINTILKYYKNEMPNDSISMDIKKAILNKNCGFIYKLNDERLVSKPIEDRLLKEHIEAEKVLQKNKSK